MGLDSRRCLLPSLFHQFKGPSSRNDSVGVVSAMRNANACQPPVFILSWLHISVVALCTVGRAFEPRGSSSMHAVFFFFPLSNSLFLYLSITQCILCYGHVL